MNITSALKNVPKITGNGPFAVLPSISSISQGSRSPFLIKIPTNTRLSIKYHPLAISTPSSSPGSIQLENSLLTSTAPSFLLQPSQGASALSVGSGWSIFQRGAIVAYREAPEDLQMMVAYGSKVVLAKDQAIYVAKRELVAVNTTFEIVVPHIRLALTLWRLREKVANTLKSKTLQTVWLGVRTSISWLLSRIPPPKIHPADKRAWENFKQKLSIARKHLQRVWTLKKQKLVKIKGPGTVLLK